MISDFDYVIEKLGTVPLNSKPYSHLEIPELLTPTHYERLITEMPPASAFAPASYPGSGNNRASTAFRQHGLVLPRPRGRSQISQLFNFLNSERFSRTLLEKFRPVIPRKKLKYFTGGRSDFTTVFDLHRDTPGYEIRPHLDVFEKIVTFMIYLPVDDALAGHRAGTFLCRRKRGAISSGQFVLQKVRHLFGIDKNRFDWSLFDLSEVRFARNKFLAFAPSSSTYHAVRLNVAERMAIDRIVLRGFIRTGRNSENWLSMVGESVGSL